MSFSLILFILPFLLRPVLPVFFHSSVLMYPDLQTDLDNLDSVENNLRHSAKGSLDAYDVTFSLTGSEKKWYSIEKNSPQGIWDHIRDKMLFEFAKADVLFFVQRLHCPGENSKAKDTEKCRYILLRIKKQLILFFA